MTTHTTAPRPRPLAIFKAGSTWPAMAEAHGDFEDWLCANLGDARHCTRVIAVAAGEAPPPPETLAGVIITGSHAMVTDRADWSERLADWLRLAVASKLPVLGICYGHQLLADALGGEVSNLQPAPEVGTITVELCEAASNDPLFAGLPSRFPAHASHVQSARRLPPQAVALARSVSEPHHAFRIGCCAWGVQFHPEFDTHSMRAYVRRWANRADAPVRDWEGIEAEIRSTPEAALITRRFADFAMASATTAPSATP
jgi:GMP synthase (glutamine-hydrolysing)